jgi:O-antigen/teichoic acid export membrane protein
VFRNFLTLSAGEIAARGMHALAFLVLARVLKPAGLGTFELATAITTYALIAVLQGFDTIAIREVARDGSRATAFARRILGLRLTLAVAVAAMLGGYLVIAGWSHPTSSLLAILSGLYFTSAISPRWVFYALEKSAAPAVATVISQVIFLGCIALWVRRPMDSWRAAAGWVCGELVAGIFLWARLERTAANLNARMWRPVWDSRFTAWILRESWPILLSAVLGNLLYNVDVLALSSLGRGSEIGVFLGAYRCITIFGPLLNQFQFSIFPGFARAVAPAPWLTPEALRLSIAASTVLLGAAFLMAAFAGPLLTLLYGTEYRSGANLLAVLAIILPLQGFRTVLRQVLLAEGRQAMDLRNIGLAAATNVILDLALIPHWGAMGCAVSTVCSEAIFTIASGVAVRMRVPVEAR